MLMKNCITSANQIISDLLTQKFSFPALLLGMLNWRAACCLHILLAMRQQPQRLHSHAIAWERETSILQGFQRAAKLRGIFSEGLLIPVDENFTGNVGDDYSEYFGVTKYEYPIPLGMSGEIESPIGHYKFPSPENLKRYQDVLIEGEEVVACEKLHGTNFTVLVDADGVTHIGSHNYFWRNSETNKNLVYIRAYHENTALQKLPPGIQVFGEIYGVQDIKYGLKNGNIGIALFAVRRYRQFLNYIDFVAFCEEFSLPRVPVLYIGAYSWEAVFGFNNANSLLSPDCIMEGVVVQPLIERTHPEIGRVVLKLISDRYLLRNNGTELH